MKNKTNFWKSPPMKKVTPKPNLELPEPKKLVKTAVGTALALGALGVGLAVFDSVTD